MAEANLRAEGYSSFERPVHQDEQFAIMVAAPFGRAQRAKDILWANGAMEVHEVVESFRRTTIVDSSPRNAHLATQVAATTDESFYVSSFLGLRLIIESPAPLSSALGIPTLIRD